MRICQMRSLKEYIPMRISGKLLSLALTVCLIGYAVPAGGQTKLAQTGFQFLSVGGDARASAMAGAFTTVEGYGSATFYNPAGMARLPGAFELMANQTDWIADISHYTFNLAANPFEGRYGVFSISLQNVDYGKVEGTMVWPNSQGYVETETINPSAMALGIGYATSLTDRFAVGGQLKQVRQYLGRNVLPEEGVVKNIASTFAVDFGTIYRTNFRGFAFGMSVRNFSPEIKYEEEGFQLPLVFKIGASIDAFKFIGRQNSSHSMLVVMDAAHPRAFSEYVSMGAEYSFQNMLHLRFGYTSGQDEHGLTGGFGLSKFGVKIDYGYTPFGIFGDVHRFTVRLSG